MCMNGKIKSLSTVKYFTLVFFFWGGGSTKLILADHREVETALCKHTKINSIAIHSTLDTFSTE